MKIKNKVCKICGSTFSNQFSLSRVCSWKCSNQDKINKAKIKKEKKITVLKKISKFGNGGVQDKVINAVIQGAQYNDGKGNFANVQRGEYDINGTTMYFRSKWEANYALYLDWLVAQSEILKWEFEPDTFVFEKIKFGTRQYTPDFKIYNRDGSIEYHEIKGYMDSKSKTKLKRMARYYPKTKVVLIDSDEYKLLKKQIGKLCKFYN